MDDYVGDLAYFDGSIELEGGIFKVGGDEIVVGVCHRVSQHAVQRLLADACRSNAVWRVFEWRGDSRIVGSGRGRLSDTSSLMCGPAPFGVGMLYWTNCTSFTSSTGIGAGVCCCIPCCFRIFLSLSVCNLRRCVSFFVEIAFVLFQVCLSDLLWAFRMLDAFFLVMGGVCGSFALRFGCMCNGDYSLALTSPSSSIAICIGVLFRVLRWWISWL